MSRGVLRDSKSAAAAINVLGGLIGLLEGGVDRGWQKTAHQIAELCGGPSGPSERAPG